MGRFKTASILTPIFISLEVVMGVLIPYVTSWIIDEGIAKNDMNGVYKFGAIMLGLAALSMLFGILAGRFSAYASSGFARNLREAMFRNIQTFSFSNIDKFSSSGLVTRMTTDVSNLQNAFQMLLRVSFRAPLNLIFSIIMCVFINSQMSIIFVVALLILGTALFFIMSRAVKLFSQVFKKYDDLNGVVQENVSAIRVVKAFVREDFENKKFSKAARALYNLFVRTEGLMALNHPVMMIVVYGCIISLSWFGAKHIVVGDLTTGQLTSLFTYVMTILSALMMLSMIFVQLTMSAASGRRVVEVINERADIVNPSNPVTSVPDGSIDFDNVSFSYKKDIDRHKDNGDGSFEYAIKDINLHIDGGETIGIIGGTGCGKSTLLNILGLLDAPTDGEYLLGGQDVSHLSEPQRDQLRKGLIGFVFQSFNLIDDLSVEENIELPLLYMRMPKAERRQRVQEAMQRMDISHRAKHFPRQLSGGQQQRVAIARAVVSRPKLILADEPTGNLDSKNGREVMELLSQLHDEGATIVMVTHSQRDASYAQRIINLYDGQVVQEVEL